MDCTGFFRKYLLLSTCSIGIVAGVWAQNTNSPYSVYGMGTEWTKGFAMARGMGDTKYALAQDYDINLSNPATYSFLKATTMDLGLFYNQANISSGDLTQTDESAGLAYFALGFPIAERWGWSMGMVPYTRVGYDIQNSTTIEDDVIFNEYTGSGGLSQVFGGLSFDVYEDSTQSISIGANMLYTFGPIERQSINRFSDPTRGFHAVENQRQSVSDILFQTGLYARKDVTDWFRKKVMVPPDTVDGVPTSEPVFRYRKPSNHKRYLSFGASVTLPSQVRIKNQEFVGSLFGSNPRDTVLFETDTGNVSMPLKVGLGLAYEVYNINSKTRWLFQADYEHTAWSQLKILGEDQGLIDAWQVAAGAQLIPNDQAMRNFWKTTRYRVGGRYGRTMLDIRGQEVFEYGISFGLGIPLVRSRSIQGTSSMLHFSYEFGQRGNDNSGLIREQFSSFLVGVSLTPSFWDKWFQRRKID